MHKKLKASKMEDSTKADRSITRFGQNGEKAQYHSHAFAIETRVCDWQVRMCPGPNSAGPGNPEFLLI